jgi:hypothetical protein
MRCLAGCCKGVQQPAPAAMDSATVSRQPSNAAVAAAAAGTLLRGFLPVDMPHVARQLAVMSIPQAAASGTLPTAPLHSCHPGLVATYEEVCHVMVNDAQSQHPNLLQYIVFPAHFLQATV